MIYLHESYVTGLGLEIASPGIADCLMRFRLLKCVAFRFKVDKKAMIRNRYNRIPHPALNTKPERDTYNLDCTKIKTAQVKRQGDSSFPTDGHKAILNKLNSKSKTNRKQTNTTEASVSNKLLEGGGLNRFNVLMLALNFQSLLFYKCMFVESLYLFFSELKFLNNHRVVNLAGGVQIP